jgi:C_GCAxxG_C_C family probable redox protein
MNKERLTDAEVAQKAYELGFEYESVYRGCAQCTVAGAQEALGTASPEVFKAASGLSAGGGLLCTGMCGGYSGGILVMSSLYGRERDKIDDDEENKRCSFRMAQELHDRFIKEYGTVICREIHEKIFGRTFDLLDPTEKEEFNARGAHTDKCTRVVALAAKWTVELIQQERRRRKEAE